MALKVYMTSAAEREYLKLAHDVQVRLRPRLLDLAHNQRPADAKKMAGGENLWRIRVGDFRVLYQIRGATKAVWIVRVGHRREVYD